MLNFLRDINVHDLAVHLTARDWALFSKISAQELVHRGTRSESYLQCGSLAGSKVLRDIQSFSINRAVQPGRQLETFLMCQDTCWVATEILLTSSNTKTTTAVIEKFIDLARTLRNMQNLRGMYAVYSALNMHVVQKLKAIWKVSFFSIVVEFCEESFEETHKCYQGHRKVGGFSWQP